jgi:hypothetical protein
MAPGAARTRAGLGKTPWNASETARICPAAAAPALLPSRPMARSFAIGIVLTGLLAAAPVASANPILNGDFEMGLTGWTVDAASSGSLVLAAAHGAPGNDTAWFGATGGQDDALSQTFATDAGASYLVSFWLGHGATDNANDFSVWWDSTPLLTLQKATKFGQTYFSFITTAIDESTTLKFAGRERTSYYYLDDVSVTLQATAPLAAIPTPEPATVILVGAGMAVWARRYRARRRTP